MRRYLLPRVGALMIVALPAFFSPLFAQEKQPDPAQAQPSERLTLEQAMGRRGGIYAPRMRKRARWGRNGKLLRAGSKYVDPLTGEKAAGPKRKPRKRNPLVAGIEKALAKALPGKEIKLARRVGRSSIPRAPEGNPGVLTAGGVAVAMVDKDLWAYREGERASQLTKTDGAKRHVRLAPDGGAVSFIENYNLFIVRTDDGGLSQLSEDGGENIFYGELDWVYQEEVWGRFRFQAAWWSPTGDHLAYLRTDENGVPMYTVLHWIPSHPRRENLKYPKAGDTNPRISLHVASPKGGKPVAIDIERYREGGEFLIVRVGWTPDGKEVLFHVQDREQTWLELCAGDPKTGKSKVLIREESKSWVNILNGIHWLKDGDFLWESERTGYRHVYRYGRDGTLKTAVTKGEWQIKGIKDIDEVRGEMIFSATKDGAVNRNDYLIKLDGSGLRRLTPGDGSHTVRWNHDKSLYLDASSSLAQPGKQALYRRDGTLVREIAEATLSDRSKTFGHSQPELVSIPMRDGYEIDAMIIKPLPFDPEKAHPVWIDSYFGPAAPTVRNAWNGSQWFQFLAQQGIVVMQLNVRSASGRGHVHTSTAYQRLGAIELKDLSDAVTWLTKKPWADEQRVGITGYSYGGFMTAYALLNTKQFKLGFAGGGVYDWRNYDTIYTERYMRKPQNNKKGYDETSCIETAGGLHGHLVIHHGTIDENVHMQNAIQLVHRLQEAGKGGDGASFELMLYPRNRHGFQTRPARTHNRKMMWRSIQKHLLPASP